MTKPIRNHRVLWKHEGSDIVGEILCPEPTIAFCHACDDSCAHGEEHGPTHLECLLADDIMTTGTTFLYCGNSTRVRSDRIEIGWDGSDWAWWYEGDTHADLESQSVDSPVENVIPDLSLVEVADTEGSQVP